MKLSRGTWTITAWLLLAGACIIAFSAKDLGLPPSLWWWTVLAFITTISGRESYSPRGSSSNERSFSKVAFWLGVVVVPIGVFVTMT
jgi:hypothetical protein